MPKRHGELLLKASAWAPGGQPTGVVRVAVELEGLVLKGGRPRRPRLEGRRAHRARTVRLDAHQLGERLQRARVQAEPDKAARATTPRHAARRCPARRTAPGCSTSPRAQTSEPAGFAPTDLSWPQRIEKAGKYDEEWLQKLYPGLAKDIDWTFFNVAPPDQQLPGFFRGDEEFLLRNLHPEHPELRCRLPGLQLRCFLRRPHPQRTRAPDRAEDGARHGVALPAAQTTGSVVFHGTAPIREDDASDVTVLYAACEDLGQPKLRSITTSASSSAGSTARWASSRRSNDGPLMPAMRGTLRRPPSPGDEMEDLVAVEQLTKKNMETRVAREVDAARAILVANGLDPDEHGPKAFETVSRTRRSIEEDARDERAGAEGARRNAPGGGGTPRPQRGGDTQDVRGRRHRLRRDPEGVAGAPQGRPAGARRAAADRAALGHGRGRGAPRAST